MIFVKKIGTIATLRIHRGFFVMEGTPKQFIGRLRFMKIFPLVSTMLCFEELKDEQLFLHA